MKKMKKLLAFVLAFAMIITIYQPTSAYAATKKPVLSVKSIALQVGKQKTLKVKNAGKNATIQWSSSKKTVATVSKKGVVKAVKAGTAKVVCKVTTKQNKNYKLVCKVVVKKAAANTVSKIVATQKELEAALKTKNLSKLTIKTDDEAAFTIPEGTYNKVALVVDAPKADVTNNAKFKSVAIKAIKPDTYRENAKGNTITVSAANARVIIEAGASVTNITVSEADGSVKLVVDGALSGIIVDAPAAVTVEGKNTTAVPVTVSEKAANATISSSTPVEVKAAAPVSVTLTKGAEGSKVETTTDKAEVTVKNDTTAAVTVVTPAGSKEVAKDSTAKVDNAGKVTDTNTSDNAGGNNSGNVTPAPTPDLTEGKIAEFSVMGSKKLSVYPDDIEEVPEKLASENITLKDEKGNAINVSEIKRDADGNGGYYITLATELTNGTYAFTMILQGKKYSQTFIYDNAIWDKMDKAQAIVKEYEKSKPVITSSALKMPKLCQSQMLNGILEKMSGDPDLDLDVEVSYEDESSINGNELTASMWIALYGDNNTKYEMYDTVTFVCTGEEVKVSAPEIEYVLPTSVVVKYENGCEYTCAKEGTSIDEISENAWYGDADDFGNYELGGLTPNTKYVIYVRLAGESLIWKSVPVTTAEETESSILCKADAEKTTYDLGTVKPEEFVRFTLQGLKTVCYGNLENTGNAGDFAFACDDPTLNYMLENEGSSSMNESDENENPILKFKIPSAFTTGDYEIKINYYFNCYACNEDGEYNWKQPLAKSEPLTYTIKFKCDGTNHNSTIDSPEVLYGLRNSIVVKNNSECEYACVKEGIKIYEVSDEAWISYADECGNMEFTGLNTDAKYTVYVRSIESPSIFSSISAETKSEADPSIICLAKTDDETSIDKGEVKNGDTVQVTLSGLKIGCYGQTKDSDTCGYFEFSGSNESLNDQLYSNASMKDEDPETGDPIVKFVIPEDLAAGTYTFCIDYSYRCYKSGEETVLGTSDVLPYTVTFTVK